MGCGEGCVCSNRHPLGAVWCSSEGRGSSHVPRDSKIVGKTLRPALVRNVTQSGFVRFGNLAWRGSAGPCFTYSVDRKCHFVSILLLRVCLLLWMVTAQLHAVAFGNLCLCIHPRFTQGWTLWLPLIVRFTNSMNCSRNIWNGSENYFLLRIVEKEKRTWIVGEDKCWKENECMFGLEHKSIHSQRQVMASE